MVFLVKRTSLRNKRKLAAVARESQEEQLRTRQSRNTAVPQIKEGYSTQVSEEIERRKTNKLYQEFSRTESSIMGALSKVDNFLLNLQGRAQSGTVPGASRNSSTENQEPNDNRSQKDPRPEVGSSCRSTPGREPANPYQPKNTLMLRKNSKITNF